MAGKALIPLLVGMMLLTGVCNTLLTKYQDMQCVRNCSSPDPAKRKNFEQPVWQTAQMFIGEMGCWLVVGASALYTRLRGPSKSDTEYQPLRDGDDDDTAESDTTEPARKPLEPEGGDRRPLTGWRVILLALPAVCDIAGTTLMNVGLLFVAASIYQMTRGALVLFVGLFSVLFLRHYLAPYKWFALFVVMLGVAIVGLAGAIEQKDATLPRENGPEVRGIQIASRAIIAIRETVRTEASPTSAAQTIIGVLLIALAQVFTASQFVIEEAIMKRFSLSPLSVVGWEGLFGEIVTLLGMFILHLAYGRTPAGQGGYFDARSGWSDMTQHRTIAVSSLLIMISIGGFNYFGLSVTRSVSATSRSTIDTCRTLFIWVVSLGLGWETFKWLQVVGFAGLVYGTFLFNEVVKPPKWRRWWRKDGELLPERPIEHH